MPCWLLIGNSRWHWASPGPDGVLSCWSEAPDLARARLAALEPGRLVAWAAVGALLDQPAPERRITLVDVPLEAAPPWLGVDRALVGWGAWRQSGGGAVLVADAGTALSLTRVSSNGRFAGGRLLAGAGLQLRALAAGTAALPAIAAEVLAGAATADPWPQATTDAMAVGIVRGLAASLAGAAAGLSDQASGGPGSGDQPSGAQRWDLWITGGDAPLLAPLLHRAGQPWRLAPALALEALASLRPGPDP